MKYCEWCTPNNEVCGTCERYFGTSDHKCSAGALERGCYYHKPFGFCPKCGRNMIETKEENSNEQTNG